MPKKVEECVEELKKQGKSKSEAWAICMDKHGVRDRTESSGLGFVRNVVIALLVLALSAAIGFSAGAQPVTDDNPTGAVIQEIDGELLPSERRLLVALKDAGVPTPDTVKIVEHDGERKVHGYVNSLTQPNTVYLMPERREHPNASDRERFPYLYGRDSASTEQPVEAHVLAHELSHVLGPRLKAEMGRPALGIHVSTDEVQAEILGFVLGHRALGWSYQELGYPAMIEYPIIQNKTVPRLARVYCRMVKATWDTNGFECKY